jgi:MFS family permease
MNGQGQEKVRTHPFGKHPMRHAIILVYMYVIMLSGMANNPLTPIATTTMKVYGLKGEQVALTTSVCQIANILFSFPSIWVANSWGVKSAMILGSFFIAAGFAVRTLINDGIIWVIIGQFIAGCGGPFISSVQAKVVTEWFDKTDRGIWIALSSLAPPLGVMIGFVLPLFFISSDTNTTIDTQKTNMKWYLTSAAIIGLVGFVLVILFWRASEPLEEGEQNADDIKSRETFIINDPNEGNITQTLAQVKKCFGRGSIRSMFVVYGIGFGMVTTVGSLITGILGCFNYPEVFGPLISVAVIVSGLGGSLVYSVKYMKERHQGRNIFIIVGFSTIFIFFINILGMFQSSIFLIILAAVLFGIFALNLNILVMEEIIRRIHGKLLVTATIINGMTAQLFSAIIIYVSGFFIEQGNEYNGAVILTAYGGIFVLLFFYCFLAEQRLKKDDVRKKALKERLITESLSRQNSEKIQRVDSKASIAGSIY